LPSFLKLVLDGQEVTGRLVQSSYIQKVLEDSTVLRKQWPHARLKLTSCRVIGPPLILRRHSLTSDHVDAETQAHLKEREIAEPYYVAVPIEISQTNFDADLDLGNVVVQNQFFIKGSDFGSLASFQGTVFQGSTLFDQVGFGESSDFSGALFLKAATFRNCEFKGQANFSRSKIGPDGKFIFTGEKLDVPLDFSESRILGKLSLQGFERTFHLTDKLYLNGVNRNESDVAGELRVKNAEFHDSFYLDRGRWAKLDFAETQEGLHRPIRFDGFCDFREGIFGVVDLGGAEFEGGGDFSKAVIRTAINFERTKLKKPIRITWDQIAGKLQRVQRDQSFGKDQPDTVVLSKESYEELERNFKASDDLYSENECLYEKRRKLEGPGFEWAISGYWVRPWRTVGWLIVLVVITFIINWNAFRRGWFGSRFGGDLSNNAVQVSLRAAALKATLPNGFWADRRGRILFLTEYVCLKLVEVFVVVTFSNASPLLKQLLPYFKLG
jgi:hypothetical protein